MTKVFVDTWAWVALGLVELIHITPEIEEEAWKIFEKYDEKRFSFTDCTSFAVMKQKEVTVAFTGNHHFQQIGFQNHPKLK